MKLYTDKRVADKEKPGGFVYSAVMSPLVQVPAQGAGPMGFCYMVVTLLVYVIMFRC